jgi:hypothetical protein
MKSNGKWLRSKVFGSKKAALIIFPSCFTESISLRYDKVRYLNEDRWEINGGLGNSCPNDFCINGKE